MTSISMTEEAAVATLKTDGMLAPVVAEFVPTFRARFSAWFDYATRLNQLGMRAMNDNVVQLNGRDIRDPISLSLRLMARAAHAFGASILLAERGLTIESNSISRSIYETGFWLGYLARSPLDAARDFMTEEMQSQLGRDRAAREAMAHEPRAIAELDNQIAHTLEAKAGRPAAPAISAIAALGGCRDHYAFYKVLCGVSAHPTLSSTQGYLSAQEEAGFYGFAFGPDEMGIGKAVAYACHAHWLCIVGHTDLLGFLGAPGERDAYQAELGMLMNNPDII